MFKFISYLSWLFALIISGYLINLSLAIHSWKPILFTAGFSIVAFIVGFIFYRFLGWVQIPIFLLINKIFYKEEREAFLEKRVMAEIGIGFWVVTLFFLLKSLIIFNLTFNAFFSQHLFHPVIIALVGLEWAISIHEDSAYSFSHLFASLTCPIFYIALIIVNLTTGFLSGEEGRSSIGLITIIALIIMYLIITPLFSILAKKMLERKRASVIQRFSL